MRFNVKANFIKVLKPKYMQSFIPFAIYARAVARYERCDYTEYEWNTTKVYVGRFTNIRLLHFQYRYAKCNEIGKGCRVKLSEYSYKLMGIHLKSAFERWKTKIKNEQP